MLQRTGYPVPNRHPLPLQGAIRPTGYDALADASFRRHTFSFYMLSYFFPIRLGGLLIALLLPFLAFAQGQPTPPNGRLVVLSEGGNNMPGELGFVGYPGGYYQKIDAVPAVGFSKPSSLHVADTAIFVAAGNATIYRYSTNSLRWVDTIQNAPTRQMAVRGNFLYATCSSAPYFRAYNRYTMQLVWSLGTTKVRNIPEGIVLKGDTAFVAVNGFGAPNVGEVSVISLLTQDTIRTVRTANNPNALLIKGDKLYAQCLDYTLGLVIDRIDLGTLARDRSDSIRFVSYGGFVANDSVIFFSNNGLAITRLATYRLADGFVNPMYLMVDAYSLFMSRKGDLFYSTTDFATTGQVGFSIGTNASGYPVDAPISPRDLYLLDEDQPFVSLGPDQSVCIGQSATLLNPLPNSNATWSDGYVAQPYSRTRNVTLLSDSTIRITVSANSLLASDTVSLSVLPTPSASFVFPDTVTAGATLSLNITGTLDSCRVVLEDSNGVQQTLVGFNCNRTFSISQNGRYSLQISAYRNGCVFNTQKTVYVESPLAIQPTVEANAIQLFPNPGNQHFTLQGVPANANLWMADLSGKRIPLSYGQTGESIELNTGILPAGIYLLHVEANGRVKVLRLVAE
jgi:hypothetical protein